VLVHGDSNEMRRLQDSLSKRYKDRVNILTPKNCQSVKLELLSKKTAKLIGKLAHTILNQPQTTEIIKVPRPAFEIVDDDEEMKPEVE